MNANNSTNIRKKSKSFLGMPLRTRRSCLMKKPGREKSRDTVPLKKAPNEYCNDSCWTAVLFCFSGRWSDLTQSRFF
jgi:hypothetical protein